MTNFYLDKRVGKNGDCQINVSKNLRYERLLSTTGLSIRPANWNPGKQRSKVLMAKASEPEAGESALTERPVNSKGMAGTTINNRLNEIEKAFGKLDASGQAEIQDYKKALCAIRDGVNPKRKQKAAEKNGLSLLEVLDTIFIPFHKGLLKVDGKLCMNPWQATTASNYTTLRRNICEYDIYRKKGKNAYLAYCKDKSSAVPAPSFSDFDKKGIENYIYFFVVEKGRSESTAKTALAILLKFLNWSQEKGYSKMPEIEFSKEERDAMLPHVQKVKEANDPIAIEINEMISIDNYKVPDDLSEVSLTTYDGKVFGDMIRDQKKLSIAKDILCFSFSTSLRPSDIFKLKRSEIYDGKLHGHYKKTGKAFGGGKGIALTERAQQILDKYADYQDEEGHALPQLDNTTLNFCIKTLGGLCGLDNPVELQSTTGGRIEHVTKYKWEWLSIKAGRKGFITSALNKGIPQNVVRAFSGHSSIAAMNPYLGTAAESERKKGVDTLNKAFEAAERQKNEQ